jgi:hypothetical protein
MKIIDRLPYHDKPTLLTFGSRTVEVRSYQIVIWASIDRLMFPVIVDTGHSHNFSIPQRQLIEWAGVPELEQIGEVEVNRQRMPQYRSDLRLHRNRPGTREPRQETSPLVFDQGITVIPQDIEGAPRMPLLGLRALTLNRLRLSIDGKRRQVTLRVGWL